MKRLNGRVLLQGREVDVRGVGLEVYKVSLPRIIKLVECPVEGCPARAKPPGRLMEHIVFWHWKSKVSIFQEGPEPLPRCDQCGMHIQAASLFKHRKSDKFHKSTDRRIQRRDVEMSERFGEMKFSLYGEEGDERVENVTAFRYLVIPLDQT